MGKSKYSNRRKRYAESEEELAGGSTDVVWDGLENPEQYCFFWRAGSPFSQWHMSIYQCNGYDYSCAEQGMMHSKALLFEDEEPASKILEAVSPRQMKTLGRKVKGFDDKIWRRHREKIVYEQNLAKFSQNEHLLRALMQTGERVLVEASPSDRIWGIGLHERDAVRCKKSRWPGQNLLGKAIMRVRETLRTANAEIGSERENEESMDSEMESGKDANKVESEPDKK